MSWNTDQTPLNYLKRRIIYLKKKRGKVRGLAKKEVLIKKYGKATLKKITVIQVLKIEKRIRQFEKAVKKLESK